VCFQPDSKPPIHPVSGAAVDASRPTLTAADGTEFAAYEATGSGEGAAAVLVLPDVRGLYAFYEELADRFAERGFDAMAIDYFGRTAGVGTRDEEFDYMPHVRSTTFHGVSADAAAGVAHLRRSDPARKVFTVGFCFGGSNAFHLAANRLGLAGAIGFYGHPDREFPDGSQPLTERAGDMDCAILGLWGGDDPGIPADVVEKFRRSLLASDVDHEVKVYEGAPHSFFDRQFEEFSTESADAWDRVLAFIARHS